MRGLAILLMLTLILACKKDKQSHAEPNGFYDINAYLSLNGQCVIECYVYMANDKELKEYLGMDRNGSFAYACLNDSAQKLLSDSNQWNLDTLHITCRLPTAEELAIQCAKGKHLYVTKVTNVSIINQGR